MKNVRYPVSLMGCALLGVMGVLAPASAEMTTVREAQALDSGLSQTVVIRERPLRTFRGETVRLGRYAESEKSIGVVRPLRETPDARARYGYSRLHGTDRYVPARVVYDRSRYYTPDKSIGVVRAYRHYDPPQRFAPVTSTNPNALSPEPRRAVSTPASDAPVPSIDVTAVSSVEIPEAQRDDPWALLNDGYYREARQQFASLGNVNDTATRTGHALAAALSGDLVGGRALMPDQPVLPDGQTLRPATLERLDLTRQVLYADQPPMQAKLQSILGTAQSTTAQAN